METLTRSARGLLGSTTWSLQCSAVRFRGPRWYFTPKKPPIYNKYQWKRLIIYHAKRQTKALKIPWNEIFPGQKPPNYKKRPFIPPIRPRLTAAELAERLTPVVARVQTGQKVLFWLDSGARIIVRVASVFIGAYIFSKFFFSFKTLSGPSMLPTFNGGFGGDIVVVLPRKKWFTGYNIGEVVLATPPGEDQSKVVAKRIRATEGDTVVLDDGVAFIVPKNHVWLQGDNPHRSIDSRMYGPVNTADIKGHIALRIFPQPMIVRRDFDEATPEIDAAWDESMSYWYARMNAQVTRVFILVLLFPFLHWAFLKRYRTARRNYRLMIDSGGKNLQFY